MRVRIAALSAALLVATLPRTVLAQNDEGRAALGQALFEEANKLLAAKQIHEACLKFKQSLDVDPTLGTLLNLADCHEQEGKVASARNEFAEVARRAKARNEKERQQYAETHMAALDSKVHKVILEGKDPGVTVKMDGVDMGGGAAFGTALPLDPGDHTIEVSAPGKTAWSKTLTLSADGQTEHVTVPALESSGVAPVNEPSPPATSTTSTMEPSPETPKSKSQLRTVGLVVGAVGLVTLGVGAYFGLSASSKLKKSACEGAICKDANSQEQLRSAGSAADISTVLFIGGGVLTATGIVLFAVAPSSSAKTAGGLRVELAAGPRTLGLSGVF